jgi:hypothetical protein
VDKAALVAIILHSMPPVHSMSLALKPRPFGLRVSVSDFTPEVSNWVSESSRRFLPALGMSIK